MITHFIPAPTVKGNYSHIALFRDNEDPFTFYYLSTTPRVCTDKLTNKPMFDFLVIGRDIKREGYDAVQEGHLVMTVDLSITDYEMNIVEQTVKDHISRDEKRFKAEIETYYPNYDINKTTGYQLVTVRNRTTNKFQLTFQRIPRQAVICPMVFKSGNMSITLVSSDLDEKFTHETKPSLFGDNNATIACHFDAQESQIFYEVLKPTKNKYTGELVNVSAVVNYELRYNTILPFRATATINYRKIYDEFQDFCKTHAGMDSKYYGKYYLPTEMGKVNDNNVVYSNGADLYISKEALGNYLKNSSTTDQRIKIKIIDYTGDSNNEQYEQLILTAMQNQLADKVSEKLFEKVEPLSPDDVQVSHYDVGTTGSQGSEPTTDSEGNTKKRNVVYDVCYRLRSDINTSVIDDYEISIEKDKIVEAEKNPNSSLEIMLKQYNIDSVVRILNASNIYFQEMVVPIKVDNSNFGRDIAKISVRVIYKGKNGAVKMDRVFNFDEEDPNAKTFRVTMDRNDKYELIDTFYYQTRINYRGYDVYGKNASEDDKWTPLKEVKGVGEGIYVPYSDMRNLCVECEAGDVAWDVIEKLAVEFKYKDAPEQNGATKLMILTPDNPRDTWNCYMYKGTNTYQYRIHYYYRDGTEDWSQVFEATSSTEKLLVNDKLSGIFRTTFDINFKESVERVRVIVKCQGKEENSGWRYQPEEWTWETRLKEDGNMTYQYKYQYCLVNSDGSVKETDWTVPIPMNTESNQQTVSINLQINKISMIIDGESIDWKKWSRVYLHFKYDDDANKLHYDDENITPIKLNESKNEVTVVLPVVDNTIRPTFYAEYVPVSGEDVIPSDVVTAGKIILLPNNAPPKRDLSSSVIADTSETITASGSSPVTPPEPEHPEQVAKDLCLTFSTKTMDWDKWKRVYIHIMYDDNANDIHINENNMPPLKMKQGDDDKSVTFQIKDPGIQPLITVDYLSPEGVTITTDATPVTGPIVVLPDAAPPKE